MSADRVTYKILNPTSVVVYLGGRRVGIIRRDCWRYWPSVGTPGEPMASLAAVKASLEGSEG